MCRQTNKQTKIGNKGPLCFRLYDRSIPHVYFQCRIDSDQFMNFV